MPPGTATDQGRVMGVCYVCPGDPLVFMLQKRGSNLVPAVQGFKFVNFALIFWVL